MLLAGLVYCIKRRSSDGRYKRHPFTREIPDVSKRHLSHPDEELASMPGKESMDELSGEPPKDLEDHVMPAPRRRPTSSGSQFYEVFNPGLLGSYRSRFTH